MSLNKLGFWEYGGRMGILTTDHVFISLEKDGKISAEILEGESCANFLAYDWKRIVSAVNTTSESSKFVSIDEAYLSVVDQLEVFILDNEYEDLYKYDSDSDETSITWDKVPLSIVYRVVYDNGWHKKVKPANVTLDIGTFLKSYPVNVVDLDALSLAHRIHVKL